MRGLIALCLALALPAQAASLEEHQAFVQSGGAAELVEAPPTGFDGHAYFALSMDDWGPRVERFLARVGAKR